MVWYNVGIVNGIMKEMQKGDNMHGGHRFLSGEHLAMDSDHLSRFWAKVDKRGPDECWNWLGAKARARGGYGQFGIRGYIARAHRVSWKLFHGDIPEGVLVLHKCGNPSCVNPDHLYLGNNSDNMMDKTRSGYDHKRAIAEHGTLYGRTYVRDVI